MNRPRLRHLRLAAPVAALVLSLGLAACDPGPPPPPGPVTTGALPIGTTDYPVPSNAIFVNPGGFQAAVNAAPSGATLVLRGGTYRETVEIQTGKRLTVQAYPHEAVWFSGSDPVSGFVPDGTAWRKDGWTTRLSRDGLDGSMLIGADPAAGHPDMMFVDGEPLLQVASRSAVRAGTFYLDENTSQLFMGTDPSSHAVEATTRASALEVRGAGTIIRGIGFEHYGTSIGYGGAVRGWHAVTFENDIFTLNAGAGVSLNGDSTARKVTATFNGQMGVHGYLANGAVVEDSYVAWNNTDHYNPESSAGGVKVYASTDVTIRRNVVNDNYGHAIWFDGGSDRAIAVNNITQRNARGAGVMFEISNGAIIAGNISTDNEAGLQSGEASNVKVYNNTMINNQFAFSGYQASRALARNITVRNNIMAAGPSSTRQMLISNDVTGTDSWSQMGWTSDHNAFYRQSTTTTPYVVLMSNSPSTAFQFRTVSQTTTTGQESHSLSTDNTSTDPYLGANNAPAGAAVGAGIALPSDVAAALGQQTTTIGAPVG